MSARVKLTIYASGGDGDVAASDFLKQVAALRELVLLSVHDADAVEAKIVGLSRNSPATIELEAFWRYDQKKLDVSDYFTAVQDVLRRVLRQRNLVERLSTL